MKSKYLRRKKQIDISVPVRPVKTPHRRIVTSIPAPGSKAVIEELKRYEPRSMDLHCPVVWDYAEGYQVFDGYGNCWIDFSSSVVLANVGHAHPGIRQAIKDQVDRKLLHNYCYPSKIRARLVQRLVEISPSALEKVFLLTTGSEATECAIKLMRMHGQTVKPGKIGIVSFTNSFHGRTMGAQMAGGFPDQKAWIVNLDPDMHQIPFPFCFNCPWGKSKYDKCGRECFGRALKQLTEKGVGPDRVAGFITETFQGPTAAFLPGDYIKALREWANEHQALLVFDEIQAGFGRTGRMFGFEHYGVEADLVCCGKGITGSLPLSAVLGRAKIMDLPGPGQMSSSHSGNPLCAAAALANIEILQNEKLVERAREMGGILERRLSGLQKKYPRIIGGYGGEGLAYAVYFSAPGAKKLNRELGCRVTESALRKGLFMLNTVRGTLKIVPPLIIPKAALLEGIDIIDESINESRE